MALALAFRLQKLEAMRKAVDAITDRPQLKRDVFTRGDPEATVIIPSDRIDASLYELMVAYVGQRRREQARQYAPGQRIEAFPLVAARTGAAADAMDAAGGGGAGGGRGGAEPRQLCRLDSVGGA